ncbi:MAG TPA: hypothetical protein VHG93_03570, partial [Longimicrobium sp.]|nr:hypothetical protein [Longimicrobium sp.]
MIRIHRRYVPFAALLTAAAALLGCSGGGSGGGGGGGGGALPVSASGKMLAMRLPGTATSSVNSITDLPQVETVA